MAQIRVSAEREIASAPQDVFRYIADYREHRPHWLPPAFSDLRVDEGVADEGMIVSYRLKAGTRERNYRMRVADATAEGALTESDTNSSLVNSWTVTPAGAGSRVRIETSWQGAGGIGGFFERLFAPRALRSLYDDALSRLDRYAHDHAQ